MDRCDVGGGGRQAAANCPDGLVGDDQVGRRRAVRYRAGKLSPDDVKRPAGLALRLGLADTDDGGEARPPRGAGLGANVRVGLLVINAPLRVPDNDGGRTGIGDHFCRNVARIGSARLGMAILSGDGHRGTARGRRKAREQRRRRGNEQVRRRNLRRAGQDGAQLGERMGKPVHFPVAGHQRPPRAHVCTLLFP